MRKEETIESKDQELSALIERRTNMDRKAKDKWKTSTRGSNRESETTKDPKDMKTYRVFLNKSKGQCRSQRIKSGNTEATRKGISNVFAKFYKVLFSSKNDERKDERDSEARPGNTYDHAIHQERTDDCNRARDEFVEDEETEATHSNDLKNNNTWLVIAKKSTSGTRNKDNAPNTSSMT